MVLVAVSLFLQVVAAVLAIRLAVVTRHRKAWLVVAVAIFLMAIRRSVTLVEGLSHHTPLANVSPAEVVALLISILFVVGLIGLAPIFGSGTEAEARARASEARLREMEARFHQFAEQSEEIFWFLQLEPERILYVSPSFERIWARPARDLYDDRNVWLKAIHAEDRRGVAAAWRRLLDSHGTARYDVEYRIVRPDGSLRWIHERAVLVRDLAGTPVQACGIAGDITGRKRAADQLRWVIEGASEALLLVDDAGIIRLANAPLGRIFRYRRDEVIGQPVEALLPDGLHAGRELTGLRRDGATVPVDVGVNRIETESGPVSLASITDITERKRLDHEREQLHERLVESQKLESLGVLAGGIAHDFNNLLTLMLGNANLAKADVVPGSAAAAALSQIERATLRASELTAQMLAYAGKGQLMMGPVDLSAVVRESTALLEAAIPGPGHLKLELGASVPAIEADPSQVRQILVSLVTNAGEALENGHGTVTVRTGSLIADQAYLQSTALPDRPPEGRYGFLEVVDDGTGMSEAVQQRMFEPFYSTRFSGRGLGLAAVSGIVRRHRGTIQVTSAPGEGTAIRVLFPLAGRPERAELAPCAVAGEPAEGKVLLVDDEADVLRLMRKFLGRAGFEVHPAASGEEGLARFKELGGSLDAVILDLTMPGMGGDELLAAIRQLDQTVPVIVASGYTEDEVARRCAGLNISAFLPKPYLPAELTAELRRAITAGRPRPVGSRSQV